MGSGGARRTPVPVVPRDPLQKALQRYAAVAADPFNFGPYNFLQTSKGVNGSALLLASEFLNHILSVAPAGQIGSKVLQRALVSLQRDNILARFPLGANVWQGIGSFNDRYVSHWADVLTARVTVVLNHLRRVRYNATKRRQCMGNLTGEEQGKLSALLDQMPSLPASAPSSSASMASSMANLEDLPDLADVQTGTSVEPDNLVEPEMHPDEPEPPSVEPEMHPVEPENPSVEPEMHPLEAEMHQVEPEMHPVEPDMHVEPKIIPLQDTMHAESISTAGPDTFDPQFSPQEGWQGGGHCSGLGMWKCKLSQTTKRSLTSSR